MAPNQEDLMKVIEIEIKKEEEKREKVEKEDKKQVPNIKSILKKPKS